MARKIFLTKQEQLIRKGRQAKKLRATRYILISPEKEKFVVPCLQPWMMINNERFGGTWQAAYLGLTRWRRWKGWKAKKTTHPPFNLIKIRYPE